MGELQSWLNQAADYKNDLIDQLHNEFLSGLGESEDKKLNWGTSEWLLSGQILINKVRNVLNNNQNETVFKISLEDESFEGCLDLDGKGSGTLKKNNKQNGLYEFSAKGSFLRGNLEGKVKERKSCTYFCDCFYRNGVRHGAFRKFDLSKELQELGFYTRGQRISNFLLTFPGGCYFIGSCYSNVVCIEKSIFIYPDLRSVIIGSFELSQNIKTSQLKVVEGHFGKIIAFDWQNGLPSASIKVTHATLIRYEMSTDKQICHHLMLSDPYEFNAVYVKNSEIPSAGEGLFARKVIEANKVVSFYNGVRYPKNRRDCGKSYKWSDFRIALDNESDLDIPPKYRHLECYRSSYGHKACHTFDKTRINTRFDNFYHPRFGQIMALISTRYINTDEEILVNYNYKDVMNAPLWYKDLWKSHNK